MNDARRIFYDFEFIDDGKTIAPISLGMVDNRGYTYYAVFAEAPWEQVAAHEWLSKFVVPFLPLDPECPNSDPFCGVDLEHWQVRATNEIASEVNDFLLGGGGVDELWADHVAYDHVALCQLLGPRMVELPTGVPWWTHDIQQLREQADVRRADLPVQEFEHNALDDAKQNWRVWQFCTDKLALENRPEPGA